MSGRKPVHGIGGDLKIPAKEVNKEDDPNAYLYRVQIVEEEKPEGARDKMAVSTREARLKWNGSVMEVKCNIMRFVAILLCDVYALWLNDLLSRDRLAFSKSILRRFMRDCVDRDPAVASPWIVKPAIAQRYGVSTVMPEETRQGVEDTKKGEIQKRKKIWEDKEGPEKKKKRLDAEKGQSTAIPIASNGILTCRTSSRREEEYRRSGAG